VCFRQSGANENLADGSGIKPLTVGDDRLEQLAAARQPSLRITGEKETLTS